MNWFELLGIVSAKATEVGETYALVDPAVAGVIETASKNCADDLAGINRSAAEILNSIVQPPRNPLMVLFQADANIRNRVKNRQSP
jgi:hypothetical protein